MNGKTAKSAGNDCPVIQNNENFQTPYSNDIFILL
jgi:hypothetical protein